MKGSSNTNRRVLDFTAIRKDWYYSNSYLPRIFRKAIYSQENWIFIKFPRHWIPIFAWFGVPWKQTTPPDSYIPFFSEFTEEKIIKYTQKAASRRVLRALVESVTVFDPVLADFLYIVDHTLKGETHATVQERFELLSEADKNKRKSLYLTGWQSYGRPSVLELERLITAIDPPFDQAVIMPCSYRRPYNTSKTHRKIRAILNEKGFSVSNHHQIVITSLGVLPQETWNLPQVLYYDAGVPDIYRILRLARTYFKKATYRYVVDCLQYEPFSDILRIAQQEGLIKEIKKILIKGYKSFYVKY